MRNTNKKTSKPRKGVKVATKVRAGLISLSADQRYIVTF